MTKQNGIRVEATVEQAQAMASRLGCGDVRVTRKGGQTVLFPYLNDTTGIKELNKVVNALNGTTR